LEAESRLPQKRERGERSPKRGFFKGRETTFNPLEKKGESLPTPEGGVEKQQKRWRGR